MVVIIKKRTQHSHSARAAPLKQSASMTMALNTESPYTGSFEKVPVTRLPIILTIAEIHTRSPRLCSVLLNIHTDRH